MKYTSVRNTKLNISGAMAIVKDFSSSDDAFLPSVFPQLSKEDIKNLTECDFSERVAFILSLFLDEFSYEELLDLTTKAYASFDGDPCPLVNVEGSLNFLELWHGSSSSSNDFGTAVLTYLLSACKKKLGDTTKTLLLVTSSGNFGKSVLNSFKDVQDVYVLAFYPNNDLSAIEKFQLHSQSGNNVSVYALNGTLDDVQNAVNEFSNDQSFKDTLSQKGFEFTIANSVSWGALLPRIACFVSCYIDLLTSKQIAENEVFNTFAPSHDFGNILACIYAKKMGVPIGNIVCATKEKDVFLDFFRKGVFDGRRKSNKSLASTAIIERLLFEVFEKEPHAIVSLLKNLDTNGKIQIDVDMLSKKLPFVLAGFATESEIKETIAVANEEFDYIIGPNTATALSVFDDYNYETEDDSLPIIISTDSPFNAPLTILEAIQGIHEKDEFKALKKLQEETGIFIPEQIANLKESKIRFEKVIDKSEIKKTIFDYLGE